MAKIKRRPGRPDHEPTAKQRAEAAAYAMVGVPHHDIAQMLGICTQTLLKHYDEELRLSKARANARVGGTLFRMASSGNNTAASIFWMKAQANWSERVRLANADGEPLPEAPAQAPIINIGFRNGGPGSDPRAQGS
jgi:hypothetical protein